MARARQVSLCPLLLPGANVLHAGHRTNNSDWPMIPRAQQITYCKNKAILNKRMYISLLFKTERGFLDFFHVLMSIHYRNKSMPRQGTHVEVQINLRSSLFPNWKELNSAIKHKDKVENQQWFLTRFNPHSSLPALCRLFITTSHHQCMLPLVICSWYKHRVA